MRSKWELKYKPQTLLGPRKERAAPQNQTVRTITGLQLRCSGLLHVGKASGDGSTLRHILSKCQCLDMKWCLGEKKKPSGKHFLPLGA